MRILNLILVVAILSVQLPASAETDLNAIRQLAKDGAPQLASELISRAQPALAENAEGWMFFEQQRYEILHHWQDWQQIIDYSQNAPVNVSFSFMRYVYLQYANALLNSNRAPLAQAVLRQLVWGDSSESAIKQQKMYRYLLIRSLWQQKQYRAVNIAMELFERDYPQLDDNWRILKSRVLMQQGQYQLVAKQFEHKISKLENPQALAVVALAELKTKPKQYRKLYQLLSSRAASGKISPQQTAQLYVAAASAAKQFKTKHKRIKMLEQAIAYAKYIEHDELFDLNAAELWHAYLHYGANLLRHKKIATNNYPKVLQLAASYRENSPLATRAIYAFLIHSAKEQTVKDKALRLFAASLSKDGAYLVNYLFIDDGKSLSLEPISDNMRLVLLDNALSLADYQRAGSLLNVIDTLPDNMGELNWGLQRVRVQILNTQIDAATNATLRLIKQHQSELDKENIDRILQVVFDLQAVKAHKQAIEILAQLLLSPMDANLQRELLFWLADSYKANDNFTWAATYYLRSATLIDGFGFDIWGQSARYEAAMVLLSANMYQDSIRQLQTLIKVTADPKRLALLKNQLQQARLKENNARNN